MKCLWHVGFHEDGLTTEEWWASKHQKNPDSIFIRSGKPSKVQSAGPLRCAECGGEVKVLVSPKRNPHSSKLGRAVSMKDHDLCRRCWRRVIQHSRQGTVLHLSQNIFSTNQHSRSRSIAYHEFPKTGS